MYQYNKLLLPDQPIQYIVINVLQYIVHKIYCCASLVVTFQNQNAYAIIPYYTILRVRYTLSAVFERNTNSKLGSKMRIGTGYKCRSVINLTTCVFIGVLCLLYHQLSDCTLCLLYHQLSGRKNSINVRIALSLVWYFMLEEGNEPLSIAIRQI